MKKLLTFDQASVTTGWAYFEDDKLIKFGHFTLDNANQVGKRLVSFLTKIKELYETYSPDEIAFEDIQMQNTVGNNVVTFKTLAEFYGMLQYFCDSLKIPYTIVPSVTWKSTLGIKGRARAEQKRNAQQYVISTYDLKPTQDEADAICIGAHIIATRNKNFSWE